MTNKWIKIAWRSVCRNKRRSMTAVITIAIASAAMICAEGYVASSFWSLQNSIIQGGTGNIQVMDNRYIEDFEETALQYGIPSDEADTLIQTLESQAAIKLVTPRINFTGLLSVGEGTTSFVGEGVDTKREKALRGDSTYGAYIKGTGIQGDDPYQIELAIDLARRLKVTIGDTLLVYGTTQYGGFNALDATVVGIYSTGIPEQDRLFMRVPILFAQQLMEVEKVTRLVVELNEYTQTDTHRPLIDSLIGDKNGTQTWYELVPIFKKVQQIYTTIFSVMGLILAIVVVVSVYNVLSTSVLERVSEIGTLRAFGISRSRITRNFMIEGSMIGMMGSAIGLVLALTITYGVNTSEIMLPPPPGRSLPYQLLLLPDIWAMTFIVGLMCGLGAFGSMFAVRKVVRKKVVDQLHYG